ncbi:3-hydroxyacyl-CoA dehydrogenase NAD-binding domain-containing protein [Micrococcus sp.]|uniref:3-hydroxyacyl-CoA dehydrogenase NAD-binding domain-containing protein n=1 Tax=Micrococcus sp. TaxID=1271 RepID=UPI002A91915C|nr:3-hydroxyacyl-CoA dehydrogenase NAD-binding domain-containing protein [Micrococcus sp.]MDY6054987.1 3-hydroxyacyl-CoA dehydrogenase NAD-binding domain-containing protein [Micrococcus sp.]
MSAFTTFEKIAVLGTGVLGSQIIMQAAWHGKEVHAYDAFPEALEGLAARWDWIREGYRADLPDYTPERFEAALARIHPTTDLAEAVGDADLVIEAVPEQLELKREVWRKVGALVPERTLLATNTSSLRPSLFAEDTGHPERFVTLHYANRIWKQNIAEIMTTGASTAEALAGAERFAEQTGMEPVIAHKEVPGYVYNSMLGPLMWAAVELYMNGVSTPEAIDRAWRTGWNTHRGPFQVIDTIGFRTVSAVLHAKDDAPTLRAFADLLDEQIAAGHTGVADGQGFHHYDAEGTRLGPVETWTLRS